VPSQREAPLVVRYRDEVVGEFRVDLLVDDLIIVEVKTADRIAKAHERQVLNYLKAAEHPVGLI
jgi:GxxExxY protein